MVLTSPSRGRRHLRAAKEEFPQPATNCHENLTQIPLHTWFLLADLRWLTSAHVGEDDNRRHLGSTFFTLLSCRVRVTILLTDQKPEINKRETKGLGVTNTCDMNSQGRSHPSFEVWIVLGLSSSHSHQKPRVKHAVGQFFFFWCGWQEQTVVKV